MTAKYKACENDDDDEADDQLCPCSFYLRAGNSDTEHEYLFVDRCTEDEFEPISWLNFYSSNSQNSSIENVDCESNKILNEDDPSEWDNLPFIGENFKCALSSDEKSYLVSKSFLRCLNTYTINHKYYS